MDPKKPAAPSSKVLGQAGSKSSVVVILDRVSPFEEVEIQSADAVQADCPEF